MELSNAQIAELVKKVLETVLWNAVQTTEEGMISLKLDYRLEEKEIYLLGTMDDMGIGVHQGDSGLFFELYERGNRYNRLPLDAANLALNVCKRILNLAGGSMEIESVYGTGSRVTFEIPQKLGEEKEAIQIAELVKEEKPRLQEAVKETGLTEDFSKQESSSEQEEKEFSIEGVDLDIGLRQWNGNLDKYKMILEVVYKDGILKLEEMRQHLSVKNYEKYMIEAHSAKSVTAGIGAMAVSELAKEQEFAVKNNKLEIVERKSEAFLQEYRKLLFNIGKSLCILGEEDENVQGMAAITAEEVENRLEKVSSLIEQYEDEEAVLQLEELLKYKIETYPVSFIKEIIENLKRFDYTKAGDRIRNRRSEFNEEDIISR